ncbi:hypothetical protein HY251_03210 [bacterium]|nr:hypothetical protein [bacterium]
MTIPGAIDKRNMLYAPDAKRPFDALALGDEFFAAGRFSEALDFFERIPEPTRRDEALARARKQAVQTGNAFLLGRIAQKAFIPVSKDDWKAAASAAKAAGAVRYALRAAIQAEDEALANELRAVLGDAVPTALAAKAEAAASIAESPEQANAGATTPGQRVEAVLAAGAAHAHEPSAVSPTETAVSPPASEPPKEEKPGAPPA